ncbi:hypothetical protein [Paenibacillus ferrarius]|uniref:hypothetical protein n=1 Tax=Paenibacillus ferrarius TaxID=1469647 RepID=UPI0013019EAC|nr:hypothetical protein [Paenibacillus ferrarius]
MRHFSSHRRDSSTMAAFFVIASASSGFKALDALIAPHEFVQNVTKIQIQVT